VSFRANPVRAKSIRKKTVRAHAVGAKRRHGAPRSLLRVLAVAALVLPGVALAEGQRAPSAADIRLSYAPIVSRVAPAVVNVYAARSLDRNNLAIEEYFRRFFGPGFNVPREQQRSLGSGVIVDAAGLIVTNNHVIEGADQVKV